MAVAKLPNSCRSQGVFIGLATVDLAYVVESIPPCNSKVSVSGQQIAAGGPATNAAITFAFLGGSSALLTAVGQHPLGAVIYSDLAAFSAAVYDMAADRQEAPPVSSILVVRESGERTVVSANANAFPALAFEVNPDWFHGVSIVLVDGHYMRMCVAAAQLAHSRGIPVVLDSGSWKDGMGTLLPYIDVAICSNDFRPPGCLDDRDALEYLVAQRIGRVAITRGAGSITYVNEGQRGEIPVEQIHAIDTLGAGDILHGAFCYWACDPGHSFPESLAFAAQVATFSCRHQGTRLWMRALHQTEAMRW
jgi:sugar/nucleoside kinase (ribokinase family)